MNKLAFYKGYTEGLEKLAAGLPMTVATVVGGALSRHAPKINNKIQGVEAPASNPVSQAGEAAYYTDKAAKGVSAASTYGPRIANAASVASKVPTAAGFVAGTVAPTVSNVAAVASKAAPYASAVTKAALPISYALGAATNAFVDPKTNQVSGNVGQNISNNAEKVLASNQGGMGVATGAMTGALNPVGTLLGAGKAVGGTVAALGNALTANSQGAAASPRAQAKAAGVPYVAGKSAESYAKSSGTGSSAPASSSSASGTGTGKESHNV